MTDDRPRPQYGEYAPPGWVSPVAAPEPVIAAPPPSGTPSAAPTRRTWDVAVTLALLGFGLYSVVSGFVAFTDAPALFRQVFAMLDNHHHASPHLSAWLPQPADIQESLIDSQPERFFRPPYVGGRGWIALRLDRRNDWDEIGQICEEAYRVIAPAKLVAELDTRAAG